MQPVLLVDFGSTYTKATAMDIDAGQILDTARAFTTAATDMAEGFQTAVSVLDYHLGKIAYSGTYACSSAAGGLRMVAVGLVPDFTVAAASGAALSAGAKVIKVYAYELTDADVEEMESLRPDIVLLTGGTDCGDTETVLYNAHKIAAIPGDFPVVVACNKSVSREVSEILNRCGKEASVCENVMPRFDQVNIAPAREQIREIFLNRIIRAKGLSRIQQMIDGILMPTPSAVMEALQCLANGAPGERGVGSLMAVDVGGATTDVYSIGDGAPAKVGVVLKGLPEPFAKRTVEGDIGVRVSARSLLDAVGLATLAQASGLDRSEVEKGLAMIHEVPDILPTDHAIIRKLDHGMTMLAIRVAMQRHVGFYEFNYASSVGSFIQTGKDLTRITKVVGTGGPVIGAARPEELLKSAISDMNNDLLLMPKNAEFSIDSRYILAAMGLLGQRHPALAVRMLKRELKMA